MAGLPLDKLERFASSSIRKRGEAYARDGSVFIVTPPSRETLLTANVTGSAVYHVQIGRSETDLFASCTCRYFDDSLDVCKHIWATVLVADEQELSFGTAVGSLFADEGELDAIARRHREAATGGGLRGKVLTQLPAQWRRPSAPSRWRAQLSGISSIFRHKDSSAPQGDAEIVYVLDPFASGSALELEIAVRTPKKNGEMSKPRALRMQSADIQQIANPLDREILSIFDGGNRYGYGTLEARQTIGWPAADFLLPRLASTGRLWMRLLGGEHAMGIALDDGGPWELVIRSTTQDGAYVFSGVLQRRDETLSLADTFAITRGGFVLTSGQISRFAERGEAHQWAAVLRRDDLVVPVAEGEEFARMIVTSDHASLFELPVELRWAVKHVVPRATMEVRVAERDTYGHGAVSFDYAGESVSPFDARRALLDEEARTCVPRDVAEEARRLEILWSCGFTKGAGDQVMIAKARFADAIPRLLADGWEVRAPEGVYRAAGALELEVSSGIDWFDLDATATFGAQRIRMPRLLAALRKGESFLQLDDGSLGTIPSQWRTQLEPLIAAAAEEGRERIRFRGNQVLLLDALLATRPHVTFDALYEQARANILDTKAVPQEPPATFRGSLREYQKDGLGWFAFLRDLSFGGCLADDMGLGKTVQVLALLEQRRLAKEERARPSLVVVPRSLVFNWKEEAARFAPELRILDHTSPDRIRDAASLEGYDVVLTTYALLRKDVELFVSTEFDYAILDEAQAIKNASSQSAKAALLIRARHRLALSGTPVENHLGELGSLFEFLNPGMLRGSGGRMAALLRDAGKKGDEAEASRALVARAVRPFILRRTKAQVATELPDRVEQTVYCELGPKQRKQYDELLQFYRASLLGKVAEKGLNRSKMHVLEALLRLRQAACHPGLVDPKRAGDESAKLATLLEELTILVDERHKVLVFSQFTSFLAIVRKELDARGIAYAYLDGQTRDRAAQVTRFQEDPELPLFLISLKAGGLGLNLTAAEYVFLLDPWWNPAVEAQAIDRAHRIGQSRNVFAYRLVARDTIEEKILLLQQSKRSLADAIVSAENSLLRQLTTEDLELLLS